MTHLAELLADADLHTGPPPAAASAQPHLTDVGTAMLAHQASLRRLLHRLLGLRAGAAELDDVLQDVLLAAWQHRERFRGDSSLATWLTRIALRKAQNHVRWRRRFWLRFTLHHDEPVAPDAGEDPRLAAVRQALTGLRHQDREVLVLRYLEGHPIETMAGLLQLQRAAVDARLSRARTALRAALPEEPS